MIKKYSGHIIGFLSSIVFFMTLAYIVKPSSESLKNENSFRVVDFIRLKKDTSLKEKSRENNTEGLIIKKKSSIYTSGRKKVFGGNIKLTLCNWMLF